MSGWTRSAGLISLVAPLAMAAGCASSPFTTPRVVVATGTTLGIKATPGDLQLRPPQFVVGYKRAEAALIPVEGTGAKQKHPGQTPITMERDAASTVGFFYLKSDWTGGTEIRSFIGTGLPAQHIVDGTIGGTDHFGEAFRKAAEKP